jgi:hypothetical protein
MEKHGKEIDSGTKKQIKFWVYENCGITLKALKMHVEAEFDKIICLNTVKNHLYDFYYLLKRTS